MIEESSKAAGPFANFRQPVMRSGSPGPVLLGSAVTALGIRGIITGMPIPGWQPLWFTAGAAVAARLDGIALIVLGCMVGASLKRRWGGYVLAGLLLTWIVVLHGHNLVDNPTSVALWLGVAEVGAVCTGAFLLALSEPRAEDRLVAATTARCAFGLCAVVFGISHFAYAKFTATMVPAWLPFRFFLAYATGTAHMAAGIAIVSGLLRRTAAGLLAVMMGSFVVLVHIPEAIASGGGLTDLTFLLNASCLCGAAWVVASTAPPAPTKC